jgi:hypothetical protein
VKFIDVANRVLPSGGGTREENTSGVPSTVITSACRNTMTPPVAGSRHTGWSCRIRRYHGVGSRKNARSRGMCTVEAVSVAMSASLFIPAGRYKLCRTEDRVSTDRTV